MTRTTEWNQEEIFDMIPVSKNERQSRCTQQLRNIEQGMVKRTHERNQDKIDRVVPGTNDEHRSERLLRRDIHIISSNTGTALDLIEGQHDVEQSTNHRIRNESLSAQFQMRPSRQGSFSVPTDNDMGSAAR